MVYLYIALAILIVFAILKKLWGLAKFAIAALIVAAALMYFKVI